MFHTAPAPNLLDQFAGRISSSRERETPGMIRPRKKFHCLPQELKLQNGMSNKGTSHLINIQGGNNASLKKLSPEIAEKKEKILRSYLPRKQEKHSRTRKRNVEANWIPHHAESRRSVSIKRICIELCMSRNWDKSRMACTMSSSSQRQKSAEACWEFLKTLLHNIRTMQLCAGPPLECCRRVCFHTADCSRKTPEWWWLVILM